LAWVDLEGKTLTVLGKPDDYRTLRLSPDEKTAQVSAGTLGRSDLWLADLGTGVFSRLRTNDSSSILGPWSPDGSRIAANLGNAAGVLSVTPASGESRNLLPAGWYVNDWSPDRRILLCTSRDGKKLATVSQDGGAPQVISETPYSKTNYSFSPDGRYVAFQSSESGTPQIVVAAFPSFSDKKVVTAYGVAPT